MSKWIQWLIDAAAKWLNGPKDKPVVKPKADPATPPVDSVKTDPVAPSTGPLVDHPYDDAFLKSQGEECGVETRKKIVFRACVWVPSKSDWQMLSTVFYDHVRHVGSNTEVDPVIVRDGYEYDLQGWLKSREPKKGEKTPPYDYKTATVPYGVKWSCWYTRKVVAK